MPVSFIESGFTTRKEYDAWLASGAVDVSDGGAGQVKVRGMPVSGNVIPSVLLCKVIGCGDMEMMNIMTGDHKTPEMLKVNPWHQMPNMSDGDLNLAESGAIIRYIANKYGPQYYGGDDFVKKATIDWVRRAASPPLEILFAALTC